MTAIPQHHSAVASVLLDEATEKCLALLVEHDRALASTPELRREVELHLWLGGLCDNHLAGRLRARTRRARSRLAA